MEIPEFDESFFKFDENGMIINARFKKVREPKDPYLEMNYRQRSRLRLVCPVLNTRVIRCTPQVYKDSYQPNELLKLLLGEYDKLSLAELKKVMRERYDK